MTQAKIGRVAEKDLANLAATCGEGRVAEECVEILRDLLRCGDDPSQSYCTTRILAAVRAAYATGAERAREMGAASLAHQLRGCSDDDLARIEAIGPDYAQAVDDQRDARAAAEAAEANAS